MRKLFASLVVWLVGLSYPLGLNAQNVRVMQWNVERGLGRLANNTNAQAQAIARIVNFNQPDVLLFNEIDCSNGLSVAQNESAITAWVTNYVPYLGTQPGATFFVKASSSSDTFIRNAAVSRYPILVEGTYTSVNMIRGLHAFRVQLEGTNVLQIFHAHFKCCGATNSSECGERQTNAVFASTTIRNWQATNTLSCIFAGDWNEDEAQPQCTLTATYRPITMVRTNGNLVQFIPTNLDGSGKTISTPSPTKRFDYCFAQTNQLTPTTGFVFNSHNWINHGLYTNASPANLTNDSTTASDHCCLYANYSFPIGATNFSVAPTNAFISSGSPGGPFSPSSKTYTLTNANTIPLFWSVTKTSSWLNISTLATNLTLAAGQSTNVTAFITNSAANSLPSGTYVDTINFSNNATGVSFSRNVTLTVLTAFESWQIQYFGSTNVPSAASNVDADGDGSDNLSEFLTGMDPTNNASSFRITALARESNNMRVTWVTTAGKTNVVQATGGSYSNNFTDLSPFIIATGAFTNYLDVAGATNVPAQYYRIRLQP